VEEANSQTPIVLDMQEHHRDLFHVQVKHYVAPTAPVAVGRFSFCMAPPRPPC